MFSDCREKSSNLVISLLIIVLTSCVKSGKALPRIRRLSSALLPARHLSRNNFEGYDMENTNIKERGKQQFLSSLLLFGDGHFTSGLRSSLTGQRSTTNNGVLQDENAVSYISRKLTSVNKTNLSNLSRSDQRVTKDCSAVNTAACHSYVQSWTYFYLKVRKVSCFFSWHKR